MSIEYRAVVREAVTYDLKWRCNAIRLECVGVNAAGEVKQLGIDRTETSSMTRADAFAMLMDAASGLRLLPFDSDELDDALGIKRDKNGNIRIRTTA